MNGTQFNAVLPAGNVATYVWDGSIAEVKGNEIPGVLKATDAINYDKLKVKMMVLDLETFKMVHGQTI